MKRSRAVPLGLVASATSLAACGGQRDALQCVERGTDRVVAESLCTASNAPTAPDTAVRARTGAGVPPIFLWYFGGRLLNGAMTGGGYAPIAGRRYASPSGLAYSAGRGWTRGAPSAVSGRGGATARGGFGGIGAGRASGG